MDDVREKLIEDVRCAAHMPVEAEEYAERIVDALGLVTDRKLRLMAEGGYIEACFDPNRIKRGDVGWSLYVTPNIPGPHSDIDADVKAPTLEAAVNAAWEARES